MRSFSLPSFSSLLQSVNCPIGTPEPRHSPLARLSPHYGEMEVGHASTPNRPSIMLNLADVPHLHRNNSHHQHSHTHGHNNSRPLPERRHSADAASPPMRQVQMNTHPSSLSFSGGDSQLADCLSRTMKLASTPTHMHFVSPHSPVPIPSFDQLSSSSSQSNVNSLSSVSSTDSIQSGGYLSAAPSSDSLEGTPRKRDPRSPLGRDYLHPLESDSTICGNSRETHAPSQATTRHTQENLPQAHFGSSSVNIAIPSQYDFPATPPSSQFSIPESGHRASVDSSCSESSPYFTSRDGPKLFSCPDCDRSFARKGDLNSHRRTHTGERPYSCTECEKTFTTNSNLRRHQRIHSNKKPYTCEHCDKAFRQLSHLKRHKVSIHGDSSQKHPHPSPAASSQL